MSDDIVQLDSNCQGPALPLDCMVLKLEGIPEPPRIFRGIIRPSLGCFFGPAKSGKTTLVENLAYSIASGQDEFLGEPLFCENRRVLLVSMEEYSRSRTSRNKKQMDAFSKKHNLDPSWRDNVFVVDESFPRYLLSSEHWKLLEREIEKIQPGFVMLDSLSRMTTDSIEDSSVASKLMKPLRELAHKHNIALVLIHHSQKMDNRPITIASLAGSRIVSQELDYMIGINRTTANARYMKDVAYRYYPDDSEYVMRFTIDDNQLIEAGEDVYESDLISSASVSLPVNDSDKIVHETFIALAAGDASIIIKTKELYQAMVSTGVVTRPTLHAALKRLEKSGVIIKPEKGCYRLAESS